MRSDIPLRDPASHIRRHRPDNAVLYFCPERLQDQAHRFLSGFPGLVSYAVKANARPEVLENLVAAGIGAFDVASPAEMVAVRRAAPGAALHYNNPVRSRDEVATGVAMGVASWSVDDIGELDKLGAVPAGAEVSVRLALPVPGAAYDFAAKFGVDVARAAQLLNAVAQRGFSPSVTFHPGTQCENPAAWGIYIEAAAEAARRAGVQLARLNVGGGFPAHRNGSAPDLGAIFRVIDRTVTVAFGADAPVLVCEPGRAMVAECCVLAARVKAIRENGAVFLNDGIYGGLSELRDIGGTDRISVISETGVARSGRDVARVVFGPTCDSLDRLPQDLALPDDLVEGDYVLFAGMGAYSLAVGTRFNGYGLGDPVSVTRL